MDGTNERQEAGNRTANPDAHLESDIGNAPDDANQVTSFDTPVRITFYHTREWLADLDGLSAKAAIDGIVSAGLLADDSPQQVAEIRHRQVKGKPEETRIVIEEIE